MQYRSRALFFVLILMQAPGFAFGQAAKPTHSASPWKRHCQPDGGFCFNYPPSWRMLGEIYDGNGVVIAPPQKDEQPLWNEITVAMVAPPKDSDEAVGLDGIIEQAAAGMRESGQTYETLRRQQRTVDAKPAELLKAQYHEKATGRDWIEELIFIQGPDNEIYSVALKCSPQDVVRLEPVYFEVVRTWMLPEPQVPVDSDGDAQPPQSPPANRPPATQPR